MFITRSIVLPFFILGTWILATAFSIHLIIFFHFISLSFSQSPPQSPRGAISELRHVPVATLLAATAARRVRFRGGVSTVIVRTVAALAAITALVFALA